MDQWLDDAEAQIESNNYKEQMQQAKANIASEPQVPNADILDKIQELHDQSGEKEVIIDDADFDMSSALMGEEWKFKKFDHQHAPSEPVS